jgi:hypothetical protein
MLKQATLKKLELIFKKLVLTPISNLEDPSLSVASTIIVKDINNISYNTILSNLLKGKVPSIQSATDRSLAFSILSTKIHGGKYDYEHVNYINSQIPVQICCPIHGLFNQIPNNHLQGKGCNICARENTAEYFIKKAIGVHKFKYDYSLVNYINNSSKVRIICKKHGVFLQTPGNHLNGCGCQICAKENAGAYSRKGWLNICNRIQNNKPSLYIIRCYNDFEEFIKIGITALTIEKRFKNKTKFPYSYEIITQIKAHPSKIWDLEKYLHKLYNPFQYTPKLFFAGNTECFTVDIVK